MLDSQGVHGQKGLLCFAGMGGILCVRDIKYTGKQCGGRVDSLVVKEGIHRILCLGPQCACWASVAAWSHNQLWLCDEAIAWIEIRYFSLAFSPFLQG